MQMKVPGQGYGPFAFRLSDSCFVCYYLEFFGAVLVWSLLILY